MFKFHKIMQQKSFPYKTHTRTHARTTHSIRHNFLVYSVLSHTQQSIIINQKLFQIEKQYYRISLKKYKIKKFLSIFIMFAINASQCRLSLIIDQLECFRVLLPSSFLLLQIKTIKLDVIDNCNINSIVVVVVDVAVLLLLLLLLFLLLNQLN